jgi:hypothetical protein
MFTEPSGEPASAKRLDFLERYLSLWVLACMLIGVVGGRLLPAMTLRLSTLEFGHASHVSIPIAILIWLMIYPMMLKIDFGGLKGVMHPTKSLEYSDSSVNNRAMRSVLTVVLAICLTLALTDGLRRTPSVTQSCHKGMAHCPSQGSHSSDRSPCVPCPANCPLCSISGAVSSPFPDGIIVRIVVDHGPADIGSLGDRLTYPPPLTPPRGTTGQKSSINS